MLEILMAIIGLLGVLFGIEKFKNNRNKKTIKKQESVIAHQEKQNNVYETHQEKTQEVKQTMQIKEKEQTAKEEKIEEVQTDEEVIDLVNININAWNNKL